MIRKTLATVAQTLALALPAQANRTGLFTGQQGHVTTGSVEVAKDAGGYVVRLGPGFSLDGAPDPKVGFGKNGRFVEGTLIGPLQSLNGAQSYRVPAGLDVADFTDVFIWCERFAVPLGVAAIR